MGNLGLACEPCDSGKADLTPDEYAKYGPKGKSKYGHKRFINKQKREGLTHAIRDAWPE